MARSGRVRGGGSYAIEQNGHARTKMFFLGLVSRVRREFDLLSASIAGKSLRKSRTLNALMLPAGFFALAMWTPVFYFAGYEISKGLAHFQGGAVEPPK